MVWWRHWKDCDIHLRSADGQVLCCRAFYHLLVMDGQEIGAVLMCDVNQCPMCTWQHNVMHRTDVSYPYRDTQTVKEAVLVAQEDHNHGDVLECIPYIGPDIMYQCLLKHLLSISQINIVHEFRSTTWHTIWILYTDMVFQLEHWFIYQYQYTIKDTISATCLLFKVSFPPRVQTIIQEVLIIICKTWSSILFSLPKEGLHQLLINLYGEHLLPATM